MNINGYFKSIQRTVKILPDVSFRQNRTMTFLDTHAHVDTLDIYIYISQTQRQCVTYFSSSIWIAWYHPIPLLGAPQPTRMTSACPSFANMTGDPPNDRVITAFAVAAVLPLRLLLTTNAAAVRQVARENMVTRVKTLFDDGDENDVVEVVVVVDAAVQIISSSEEERENDGSIAGHEKRRREELEDTS